MVSCCPTLPWYPECWSRCWRLVSILGEQWGQPGLPCHSRKARLAAELTASPLKHALEGMRPCLVPQAQSLSGRVSGEAFPMDDYNDRANLSQNINFPKSNSGFYLDQKRICTESSWDSLSIRLLPALLEDMDTKEGISMSVHLTQLIRRLNPLS